MILKNRQKILKHKSDSAEDDDKSKILRRLHRLFENAKKESLCEVQEQPVAEDNNEDADGEEY